MDNSTDKARRPLSLTQLRTLYVWLCMIVPEVVSRAIPGATIVICKFTDDDIYMVGVIPVATYDDIRWNTRCDHIKTIRVDREDCPVDLQIGDTYIPINMLVDTKVQEDV